MSYADKATFLADFHAAQSLALQQYGEMGGTKGMVSDDVAWSTYCNANKPADNTNGVPGLMLFGRHQQAMRKLIKQRAKDGFDQRQELIAMQKNMDSKSWLISRAKKEDRFKSLTSANFDRQNREENQPLPPAVDTDPNSPMVKNFGLVNNQRAGGILLMGNENWNFTINDTWLVGAVHRHLPFYPACKVAEAHIFSEKRILTITGRELFGLALFGYQQVEKHPALGCGFECTNNAKAAQATLEDYQTAISGLKGISDAAQVIAKAGFQISKLGI